MFWSSSSCPHPLDGEQVGHVQGHSVWVYHQSTKPTEISPGSTKLILSTCPNFPVNSEITLPTNKLKPAHWDTQLDMVPGVYMVQPSNLIQLPIANLEAFPVTVPHGCKVAQAGIIKPGEAFNESNDADTWEVMQDDECDDLDQLVGALGHQPANLLTKSD